MNQRGGRKTEKASGFILGKHKRLTATLPAYLFDWLKAQALKADKSISSQIVEMLESFVPNKKPKAKVRRYRTNPPVKPQAAEGFHGKY